MLRSELGSYRLLQEMYWGLQPRLKAAENTKWRSEIFRTLQDRKRGSVLQSNDKPVVLQLCNTTTCPSGSPLVNINLSLRESSIFLKKIRAFFVFIHNCLSLYIWKIGLGWVSFSENIFSWTSFIIDRGKNVLQTSFGNKDVQSVLSISFKNGMKSVDGLLTPFRTETLMKP